jgi:hypothetical protein
VKIRIVGTPSAESDVAVARFFERFLQRENPGTVWRSRERLQDGSALEATAREVSDITTRGIDDEGPLAA